jgi:fructose-specific phosphotransferase system IIA component
MNLSEILSPACVRVPLDARDKKGIIDELVDLLAAQGRVSDAEALKTAVWSRETTRTTGIGHALAIPHGKCEGVKSLAMAIGKPAEPVDFAAIDGKPVRMIVLLASPPEKTNDHIQALAKVSRLMNNEEFRSRIYAATTSSEVYDLLVRQDTAPAPARV